MNLSDKTNQPKNWKNSLILKMVLIVVMVLLLLIPLGMIKSVIYEREDTEHQVDIQMMEQWGGPQTITGPTLNIPVYYYSIDEDDKKKISQRWLHVMPEELQVDATVEPEMRYRGIYKKVVFQSNVQISGHFGKVVEPTGNIEKIDWENAVVSIGISDNRSIEGEAPITWDGNAFEPQGGMVNNDLLTSGISAAIPIVSPATKKVFSINLNLRGSKGIYFNPIGKMTNVTVESSWSDPSFTGSFLPTDRQISEEGFSALWQVTHLNRNFPQQWVGTQHEVNSNSLGVDLFVPVNHYQKSLRSAKYGLLIITLTVLVFVFIELGKKKKIHLLQYTLVGLALVLFFSILTALSEHIGFNLAYLVASIGIIHMVSLYSFAFLKDYLQALLIFILLAVIYGFLFVLLSLNDYAFLAGNIGLFIALAVIMKASGKVKLEA